MASKKRQGLPTKKIFVGLFLLSCIILFFVYNPHALKALLPSNSHKVTVRLKWANSIQSAGLYVAEDKKMFNKNELQVKLLERDFTKDPISDEVATGRVDFGITNVFDVVNAINQGKNIKVIAATYQHSPGALVSLKQTGITSPADFAGKKIGISSDQSGAMLFYKYLFSKYKIPLESATFITVGNKQIENLENGTVDVVGIYRTNESYDVTSREIPHRLMLPEYYGLDLYGDLIITTTDMIEKKPELVRQFVQAVVSGWEWTLGNQEETFAITSNYSTPQNDNVWKMRYGLSIGEPLIKPDNTTRIGSMTSERWEKIISTLVTHGVLAKTIPADRIFTNDFLK